MAPNPKRNLDDSERGKKKNANEIIELSDDEMFETQKENNEPQEEKVQVQEEQIETQKEKPIGKIEKSQLLKIHDLQPGKLMIAGMISWKHPSYYKNTKEQKEDINSFHRFTDEMYRSVASGCSSLHNILINMDRKAMSFGENSHGQLGQPKLEIYTQPTLIDGLKKVKIIQAACGRHHSLFLSDDGVVYACGDNAKGQCGRGTISTTPVLKPKRIKYYGPPIIKVGCGAFFSVILDNKGNLHTFGLPEYGQLGHNTDGKYFAGRKLTFDFEASPKRITSYIQKSEKGLVTPILYVHITDFACGNNHTVAVDSNKRAFSWGFGGTGRLGHAKQEDEMVPRHIKLFERMGDVRRVFCGTSFSLAVTDNDMLFMFGSNNPNANANMYPKPVHDLCGWNITSIGCSSTSIVISADDTLIGWGASPTYGELGFGEAPKSSVKPKKVEYMEGMKIPQVAMGIAHTLLLVDTNDQKTQEKYLEQPEYIPKA